MKEALGQHCSEASGAVSKSALNASRSARMLLSKGARFMRRASLLLTVLILISCILTTNLV